MNTHLVRHHVRVRSWIRILNHPAVPGSLLLLVVIVWGSSRLEGDRLEEIASVDIRGPEVPLDRKCTGTWTIRWPEWDQRKGEPALVASGLPITPKSERTAPPILLRVHPPNAVRLARERSFDAEGWFAVWDPHDWGTVAYVDRFKADAVEYRVDDPQAEPGSTAMLVIEGSDDPFLLEGVLVGRFLLTALALVVAVPLCIWLVSAWIHRRRLQRDLHDTRAEPEVRS